MSDRSMKTKVPANFWLNFNFVLFPKAKL